jgi:hypothetical protein
MYAPPHVQPQLNYHQPTSMLEPLYQQMMYVPQHPLEAQYVPLTSSVYPSTSEVMHTAMNSGLLAEDFVTLQRLFTSCCINCGQGMVDGYRHHCHFCNIDMCTGCVQAAVLAYGFPHQHMLITISL